MYLDIQRIKNEISFSQILDLYHIRLHQRNPQQLFGPCPIHHGDNPNAFQVNLNKNLFHCFTHCGGGTIFDFIMKKENLSFYQAAAKIHNLFYKNQIPTQSLLSLQYDHPYLKSRNISPSLAHFFQLGFCNHGYLKNRIAIPIFNKNKSIAAHCGRSVDHSMPKYLFPKNFSKNNHLFNIQNVTPDALKPLFIVEGFFDAIHLAKLGFDAVALMGSTMSNTQAQLLKESNRHCFLMLDGDPTGQKATPIIAKNLRLHSISFNTIRLNENLQPDSFDYHTIKILANI